jgi:PTS system nitrogen regulatory IIA component
LDGTVKNGSLIMDMNIQEVAERLHMPVETVQRWVRQGKIPMQQTSGNYTIRPEMLARWAAEHHLKVHDPKRAGLLTATEQALEGLLPAMRRGGFLYHLSGGGKEALLRSAVDGAPNLAASDRDRVHEKLLEREQLASTGIGHGIALPHPRSHLDIRLPAPQITTCFLAQPVAFDAIDGRPVSVMMILLSGSTKEHLSLLSKLSFYLRDRAFREYLLSAPPAGELLDKVAQMEAQAK